MRKIIITQPCASRGEHFEVKQQVALPDQDAAAIVSLGRGRYADDIEDGDPEVENRDPQPKKKKG